MVAGLVRLVLMHLLVRGSFLAHQGGQEGGRGLHVLMRLLALGAV